MQKFSIKEARFVFQQPGKDGPEVEVADKSNEKPKANVIGFRNPDGSFYKNGLYHESANEVGVVMNEDDAAFLKEAGAVPILADKAGTAAKVADVSVERRTEVKADVRKKAVAESGFKLDKFQEEISNPKVQKLLANLKISGVTTPPYTAGIAILKNKEFKAMASTVEGFLFEKIKDRDVDAELLKSIGGTKEEFLKGVIGWNLKNFPIFMNNLMEREFKHLSAFLSDPKTKFSEFSYKVRFDEYGNIAQVSIGPEIFKSQYDAFAANIEKNAPKPTPKEEVDKRKAVQTRLEKRKKLQSIPLLKWLSGLLGLNEKEKDENGKVIPNGRDGWDKILDGENTVALAALDFFGYGKDEGVPQAEGQFDGFLAFVPGASQGSIKALRKSVNQQGNKLSAKAYRAQLALKSGKPQETEPGVPPFVAHQPVKGRSLGEIMEGSDKKIPRKGVRLYSQASMEGLGVKAIKFDLNSGNLIVPQNSDLVVNGKKIGKVEKGKTKTFTKNDGKNGIITISGILLEGTVIDEDVKIEKVV